MPASAKVTKVSAITFVPLFLSDGQTHLWEDAGRQPRWKKKKLNKVSEKVALSFVRDKCDCGGRRRYGSGKPVDTFGAVA